MPKDYRVTNSFENDERNRCVDIVQRPDGRYGFQEWRREPEDLSGWFLMFDSQPTHFESEPEAISCARSAIFWFMEKYPACPR